MNKYTITIICFGINLIVFSQNFPYKLNRAHKSGTFQQNPCEFGVNVKDNRPSNCTFDNTFYMYPVYIEEFNTKEELPNNWRFSIDWRADDDYKTGDHAITWLGDAYTNNNIYTTGGYGYLEWKKESVYGKHPVFQSSETKDYDFTGAFLNSFFKLRQGVFEAKIKLPENPYFWPAYWLFNNQEIDIFEFFDSDITSQNTCDTYHHMKMNVHGYIDGNLSTNYSTNGLTHCNRNRKFAVPSNFFNNDHIYKCVWTDYKIDIYLDNTLVSTTSKYYDGPFFPTDPCHSHSEDGYVPAYNRDCNYMSNAPGCSLGFNVPNWPDFWHSHFQCYVNNTVKKDMTFPETTIPMSLIISNSLSHLFNNSGALEDIKTNWYNFDISNRRIGVDWIKVYQPLICSAPRYICSISDFKSITGNTNFLSGSTIQMGNGSSCNLVNTESANFPMHILASDEIQFLGNMIFEEGTYLRAEIIDCNGGFNQYQRTTQSGEKLYLTDEEIAAIEQRQNDSLMKNDPAFRDSINAYNERQNQYKIIETKSALDNGAITIFPNPADKFIQIAMVDEDFYDLYDIEIIDNLGRIHVIEKSKTIDISFLNSGFYQIKFKFSHGYIVVKNFVKK